MSKCTGRLSAIMNAILLLVAMRIDTSQIFMVVRHEQFLLLTFYWSRWGISLEEMFTALWGRSIIACIENWNLPDFQTPLFWVRFCNKMEYQEECHRGHNSTPLSPLTDFWSFWITLNQFHICVIGSLI